LERAKGMVVADPAAALKLVDRVLSARAGRQDDRLLGVEAAWLKAQALSRMGRNQEALDIVEPAIIEANNIKVKDSLLGDLIFTRAGINRILGNLTKSTIDIQKSIQLFQNSNDNQGLSKSYILIASVYSNAGNYKKSKDYYDQAISLGIQDKFTKFVLFNNIGGLERSEKKYIQSADNFRRALLIAKEENYPEYLELSIVTSLASVEISNKRYSIAQSYINRGNQLSRSDNLTQERIFLEAVKAQFLADKGNYKEAAIQFDRAFSSIDFSKTGPQFNYFHQLASDVYIQTGRYDLAVKHLRAFKRLDDQARDLMVNTNSALMAAQFDFANQDLKIARLQADQLKKDAELARSRNRIVLIVLGGLAITVGLLGFNFLSLRRSSRRITSANTQLSQANQSLETALKARSEFLATTSHEIRTPLNGILGVTQVLLSDPGLNADVRDRISLMNGAGETMRALVNDLLDMAKIESGTLTLEKGETDLNGLLDDAVRLWTDKAREKGLDLVIDRGGAPGRILEDGPRLRQIVFNLLSNAIKFTEAGSVRLYAGVEAGGTGERLILGVADTGIGIPADQLDAVFESFQQVEGGVTRRFEGTGLGLSISRRLAEAMGGTLGVESQMGEGSTFTLILPLVRASAAAAASAAASSGVFLIIEANPLTQSVLKSIAAPLGLPIDTASSPEAAAQVLATGHVSALLVDAAALGPDRTARMAAIAGLVAAGARGLAVTWPSPDPEDIEAALAAGAVKVIAKPISAARLTETLRTLLPESA
jgi:signal transduction histidine kinase/CheY-like chemotaxis protein